MNPKALSLILISTFTTFAIASDTGTPSPLGKRDRVVTSGRTDNEGLSTVESSAKDFLGFGLMANLDFDDRNLFSGKLARGESGKVFNISSQPGFNVPSYQMFADDINDQSYNRVDRERRRIYGYLYQKGVAKHVHGTVFTQENIQTFKEIASSSDFENFVKSKSISPDLFRYKTMEGVNLLTFATQNQIDYLAQNYGDDLLIMDRLVEACCLSNNLRLPYSFFNNSNPTKILRRFVVASTTTGIRTAEVLRQAITVPKSLTYYFDDGETILTKAIQAVNTNAVSLIFTRPDARDLVNLQTLQSTTPIHAMSAIRYKLGGRDCRTQTAIHLFSFLDKINETRDMETMRDVNGLIQSYVRDAKECGDVEFMGWLLDKIVELMSVALNNINAFEHCQEYKEAALSLVYAYADINETVNNTNPDYKEIVNEVKSHLSIPKIN